MMKNSIIHSIVLALAISSFATVTPKDAPSAWQKTKTFLKKHRSKIAAGVTAAAIIGLTIGLAYHGNRTMKAIEAAGLTPTDKEFETAVAAVGLLGPLGEKRAIKVIQQAVDNSTISKEQAIALVTSKVGAALANYWGISHEQFIVDAGYSGVKAVLKEVVEDLKRDISKLAKFVRG